MNDEQERRDVMHLWQGQVTESSSLSLDDLRRRVLMINRLMRTRAVVAALALALFIVFFGEISTWRVSTLVTKTDITVLKFGFVICAACSFWWLVSLLRRARHKGLTDGGSETCVAFYMSELKRQRNSYRRSAVWIPMIFSAAWIWCLLVTAEFRGIMIVIWILFVPFWVYHNMRAARTSQRELDELSARLR